MNVFIQGVFHQHHPEWIGLSLLSAALRGLLLLRLAPSVCRRIRLDAPNEAPLSASQTHSSNSLPPTSHIFALAATNPPSLSSCLEAMAMAVGSSCRATVGSLPVAQAVSVRASSPRSSVSLSSAFVGLRLQGVACRSSVMSPVTRRSVVVRAAAAPTKKPDQAAKRARQNEKRRVYHKSKKSEISTRMKKVFVALDGLKKKSEATEEDFKPIEKLIGEAFKIIDKAAKVGSLHRNKAGHQKSRLSRAKRTMLIQLGLYTPSAPSPEPTAA